MHAAGPVSGAWADVGGILLPVKASQGRSSAAAGPQGFIQTQGAQKALQSAALALSQQRPLLLEGPPGEQHAGQAVWILLTLSSKQHHVFALQHAGWQVP